MRILYTFLIIVFSLFTLSAQIPDNYYDSANNLSGETLKSELHSIIDNHTSISYSELWEAFKTTDVKSNGTVWDIYSDIPNGTPTYEYEFGLDQNTGSTPSSEGGNYNREHSFPQSWFNKQSPMVSDLFHIYPTDSYVNGKRANYPFGETNSATWTSTNGSKLGPCTYEGYTGTIFEPIDEYKGDLARTYFYMATRYYGEDSNWTGSDMVDGTEPKQWAVNMLLEWNEEDPVSQKEIDRNNAIYDIQGNRNPFIDHPEYVAKIWNSEKQTQEPTNNVSDFSSASITLNWLDATGNNLPSGYLIFINTDSFDAITPPTDGNSPATYTTAKNVAYGIQTTTFAKLEHKTTYYFKIYSYSGSGTNTDYKTDGNVPQLEKVTP